MKTIPTYSSINADVNNFLQSKISYGKFSYEPSHNKDTVINGHAFHPVETPQV